MNPPFYVCLLILGLAAPLGHAQASSVTAQQIKEARLPGDAGSRAATARLQIALDRAQFSPGVIDGRMGENVENALQTFRRTHDIGRKQGGLDEETWSKLKERAPEEAIVSYTISKDDVDGPFTKTIPEGFEEKKSLDRLGYTGPRELIAEKFHMDEDFLQELNPGADFGKAGTKIMVANVKHEGDKQGRATRVEVDKGLKQVRAFDGDKLVAAFPATVGSESRPAPSGTLEVKGVAENPKYTYNPEYKFEGVKTDKAFTIAPGPNNPVGIVWIDLSKEGYGIHGTPDPAKIGKTASHGCVRLTNWDAQMLAKMVKPGVKVEFLE